MLSIHAQIKYKKSIWGVVKGFIEKNTWAGLEDFFCAQLQALQSETCIPPAKGKGRRPRRGKHIVISLSSSSSSKNNNSNTANKLAINANNHKSAKNKFANRIRNTKNTFKCQNAIAIASSNHTKCTHNPPQQQQQHRQQQLEILPCNM